MKRTTNIGVENKSGQSQTEKTSIGEAVRSNILIPGTEKEIQTSDLEIIKPHLSITDQYKLSGIVNDIEVRLMNIKHNVYEIGRLLNKAKFILPHGSFEKWIEETFRNELPYPTGYAFMKIYEKFKDNSNLVQKMPTTFLLSMSQKSFPDELIKLIEENADYLEKEDIKNVQIAYKDFKSDIISLGQFENTVQKQIQLAIDISKGKVERRLSNNNRRTLINGMEQIIKAIETVRKRINNIEYSFPPVENSEEQDSLLNTVKKALSELQQMKEDLENGRGLFRPHYPKNPLLAIAYNKPKL